jgi:hypothetical protein
MSMRSSRYDKSAVIHLMVANWGLFWQLGGRDHHRDAHNIFRLEFFRGGFDAHIGWRLWIPFEGGLLYYRCKAGRWEGWQLRGPWQKVLG